MAKYNIASNALFAILTMALLYAGGIHIIVCNVWLQVAFVLRSVFDMDVAAMPAPTSAFWRLCFPVFTTIHKSRTGGVGIAESENGTLINVPDWIADPPVNPSSGYIITNEMPFFQEAHPFFIVSILLELGICLLTNRRDHYSTEDTINSLSLGILSQTVGIFTKVFFGMAYVYVFNNWRITELPEGPLTWWLMLIGVDFGFYWFHRYSHESNLLWSQHVVHHSSEEYNLSTALRQPLVSATGFAFYLPLALFMSPSLAAAHQVFNLLYQYWIHTRVIGKLGWLEYILNTPSHHRVHHGRNPYCIDTNYGGIFIIWDRMFGTFQEEKDDEEILYGIVPPLRDWNPVWANMHKYYESYRSATRAPGWNKARYFYKGPGWMYSHKKGSGISLKVPKIGHKFNPTKTKLPYLPLVQKVYAGIQFTIVIGCYFFIEISHRELLADLMSVAAVSGYFLVSLVGVSKLIEPHPNIALEGIRMVLAMAVWTWWSPAVSPNFQRAVETLHSLPYSFFATAMYLMGDSTRVGTTATDAAPKAAPQTPGSSLESSKKDSSAQPTAATTDTVGFTEAKKRA